MTTAAGADFFVTVAVALEVDGVAAGGSGADFLLIAVITKGNFSLGQLQLL